MNIFGHFDQIRIINLPERTDRRRAMDRELAAVGLIDDPRVQYFKAFRPEDAGQFSSIGARGCYDSHKTLLKEATMASGAIPGLIGAVRSVPGSCQAPNECRGEGHQFDTSGVMIGFDPM